MRKKFRSVLVFTLSLILIVLSTNIFATATEDRVFLYPANLGDVNGDDKITAADARLALRISARLEPDATEYMINASDYNNDKKVSATDARSILRISARLEEHPFSKEKQEVFKEALDLYVELMNKAKADKPGFSMIYYLDAPGDSENRKFIADEEILELLEGFLDGAFDDFDFEDGSMSITREEAMADKIVHEKGSDMSSFPLIGRDEGAISFDERLLKDVSVKDLQNGNKEVRIVLNDEKNPSTLAQGADVKDGSFTSYIFMPMADVEEVMPGAEAEFHHFDCTAILEYNPTSKQIVSLKHEVNAALIVSLDLSFSEDSEGFSLGFLQNIFSTYEWFDFEH